MPIHYLGLLELQIQVLQSGLKPSNAWGTLGGGQLPQKSLLSFLKNIINS